MAKGRKLNQEEQSLWNYFTNGIKSSNREKYSIEKEVKVPFVERPYHKEKLFLNEQRSKQLSVNDAFIQHYKIFKQKQIQHSHVSQNQFITIGTKQSGLDTSTWKKFHKGQMSPEKILDLHGYTAQRAFFILEEFLLRSQRSNIRCVEVITGIGTGYKEGGILKRELPYWLNRPNIQVLILATTYPAQWNGGAVRILLKRNRFK
ncbi:Smr/MutS family protein [Commensalibacter oyaizuii]|uniref:Smr/MutS family protein n=1 Tax=Commensalibacter oyaizuii TaxID=3043873 RepID=A0ABT6PYS5_9PROT|nr:Smr/MutS family protein [Commensalibacter sp. TBRC 16381]MDI2090017.1 Smr/MutS family protein [Commensalibacter sp. TBRC 16381]